MNNRKLVSQKKEILEKLENTYCRLKSSNLHDVGVFAIRDIPKGTDPFYGSHEPKWVKFNASELSHLHPEILKMIDDYWVIENDGSVIVPDSGLNGMDISSFLNHSAKPNVKTGDKGITFLTKTRIKKGMELTTDYRSINPKYAGKGR